MHIYALCTIKAYNARFHGMFAPNSQHRARVTPAKRGKGNQAKAWDETQTPAERRASMTWAQRLKRVFNIYIVTCRACGGAVKVIVCIEDSVVIKQILDHLRENAAINEPTPCPRPGRRQPACSTDIQNRPFDSISCAVTPRWGHGLPDGPAGAAGAEKAGQFQAGRGGFRVNSG